MSESVFLEEIQLANGLNVCVKDITSHYFGGYYHVRLEVSADVPLTLASLADDELQEATGLVGDPVYFTRTLERMAVPESGLEPVRQELLGAFRTTVLSYLDRADFAHRFVTSRMNEAQRTRRASLPRYR